MQKAQHNPNKYQQKHNKRKTHTTNTDKRYNTITKTLTNAKQPNMF